MKPSKLIVRRIFNGVARLLTGIVCRVHAKSLTKIPLRGPIIIIVNHVNFLELPIIYPRIPSDLGVGYSKAENWNNLLFRTLFTNWDLIPIERDEVDVTALRKGLRALEEGRILFITPEGTRSHHGRLQQGKPGVVLMAERSGAPIWPIACYGGETFTQNLKRLRRTDFYVVVGNPFHVDTRGVKITGPVRQQVVDEMMYQIAALLPPRYRGYYSDLSAATEIFLKFEAPEKSNLWRARQGSSATQEGSSPTARGKAGVLDRRSIH
ncbi:MAG: lysophospholipid acyltransferase family protein [Anaerolineae bacterium]